MIPRKPNSFFPQVAEETGLSEQIVEDIIDFYWKDVRRILTNLGEKRIQLICFGTFTARKMFLKVMLEKYTMLSTSVKVQTYSRHALLEANLKKLNSIKKLLESFEKEEQRHKLIKEKRNARNI